MNKKELITIRVFDDGNQRFKHFVNKWIIEDIMHGGGKLKLKNKIDSEIIIPSISTWKVFKLQNQ